jgi:hypothetical protein
LVFADNRYKIYVIPAISGQAMLFTYKNCVDVEREVLIYGRVVLFDHQVATQKHY